MHILSLWKPETKWGSVESKPPTFTGNSHDVLHVDVDELVGEEAPGLLAPVGVVDEERADLNKTVGGEEG